MTKLIKNIEPIRLTKPKSIMRTIKHLEQLREHLRLKQLCLERKFLRGRMWLPWGNEYGRREVEAFISS